MRYSASSRFQIDIKMNNNLNILTIGNMCAYELRERENRKSWNKHNNVLLKLVATMTIILNHISEQFFVYLRSKCLSIYKYSVSFPMSMSDIILLLPVYCTAFWLNSTTFFLSPKRIQFIALFYCAEAINRLGPIQLQKFPPMDDFNEIPFDISLKYELWWSNA